VKKFPLYFFLLLFLSAIAFVLIFHSEPTKFHTVTVAGKFSISIPEYLSKTNSIDSSALLQCKNEKEQIFLLVYKETDTSQQKFETQFRKFSDDFIAKMEHGNLVRYFPIKINNHDAFIGNIRGNARETKVYYRIAEIKVSDKIYKIIIGTTENNKSRYDEDMDKIIKGFEVF
jgi:hypothetical protein